MQNNATQFLVKPYAIVSREAISYIFKFCSKLRHNFCLPIRLGVCYLNWTGPDIDYYFIRHCNFLTTPQNPTQSAQL